MLLPKRRVALRHGAWAKVAPPCFSSSPLTLQPVRVGTPPYSSHLPLAAANRRSFASSSPSTTTLEGVALMGGLVLRTPAFLYRQLKFSLARRLMEEEPVPKEATYVVEEDALVERLEHHGEKEKQIYLVGCFHKSPVSPQRVHLVLQKLRPDSIMVQSIFFPALLYFALFSLFSLFSLLSALLSCSVLTEQKKKKIESCEERFEAIRSISSSALETALLSSTFFRHDHHNEAHPRKRSTKAQKGAEHVAALLHSRRFNVPLILGDIPFSVIKERSEKEMQAWTNRWKAKGWGFLHVLQLQYDYVRRSVALLDQTLAERGLSLMSLLVQKRSAKLELPLWTQLRRRWQQEKLALEKELDWRQAPDIFSDRERFMIHRLKHDCPGKIVVAVIGTDHLEGITRYWNEDQTPQRQQESSTTTTTRKRHKGK
ncbi:hypothetical protein QOT17_015723 [Balamuthia mandrillaris]